MILDAVVPRHEYVAQAECEVRTQEGETIRIRPGDVVTKQAVANANYTITVNGKRIQLFVTELEKIRVAAD